MARMFGQVVALDVTRQEMMVGKSDLFSRKLDELKRSIQLKCPACVSCHTLMVEALDDPLSSVISIRAHCNHESGGRFVGDMVACPDGFVGVITSDKKLFVVTSSCGENVPRPAATSAPTAYEPILAAIPTDREFFPPLPPDRDVPAGDSDHW